MAETTAGWCRRRETLDPARGFVVCLLLAFGTALVAADAETAAIDRAKMLLASRGRFVAIVVVLDEWPINAPSPEALAANGTIFVSSRSHVLRAAVRSTVFDVLLASLLLHEHSHLLGANERQALQIELGWLEAEHAGDDTIRATRRSIERGSLKRLHTR